MCALIMMNRFWYLLEVRHNHKRMEERLMIGAVFDNKEGERIAKVMGNKKIGILQNHGTISLGKMSIDEAAWW
jgi:ribulose-5-phosphate 4-epimerase/fuculose-1-phosphate aldolase